MLRHHLNLLARRDLLQLDDGTQCRIARGIAERKLEDVRVKLSDLRRIEAALAAAGYEPRRALLDAVRERLPELDD